MDTRLPSLRGAAPIVATFGLGLALDARAELPLQLLIGLCAWAVLFGFIRQSEAGMRRALFACLALATLGELFLSLVWGLYVYRLGNIPLFVPPGHGLLFLLSVRLAPWLSRRASGLLCAAIVAGALAVALLGLDDFSLVLVLAFAAAVLAMPARRGLYATAFVLSLALELYGTWLKSWTWVSAVPLWPGVELKTSNPPLAAGAFYCLLDVLVLLLVRGVASGPPRPAYQRAGSRVSSAMRRSRSST